VRACVHAYVFTLFAHMCPCASVLYVWISTYTAVCVCCSADYLPELCSSDYTHCQCKQHVAIPLSSVTGIV